MVLNAAWFLGILDSQPYYFVLVGFHECGLGPPRCPADVIFKPQAQGCTVLKENGTLNDILT